MVWVPGVESDFVASELRRSQSCRDVPEFYERSHYFFGAATVNCRVKTERWIWCEMELVGDNSGLLNSNKVLMHTRHQYNTC
jgi:hypothetical protein